MPKIKIKRQSVSLDMTAMCDVAFLLLSFFMLTTTFKPEEPLPVDTPSSVSEIPMPDKDHVIISIGKKGEVFFGVDGNESRVKILERVAEKYKVPLTKAQKDQFSILPAHGVPIRQLPAFLDLPPDQRSKVIKKGIPVDTNLEKNELRDWVISTIGEGRKMRYVIKGDGASSYKTVKWVIATMQDLNINRFNLITSLERAPTTATEKK